MVLIFWRFYYVVLIKPDYVNIDSISSNFTKNLTSIVPEVITSVVAQHYKLKHIQIQLKSIRFVNSVCTIVTVTLFSSMFGK